MNDIAQHVRLLSGHLDRFAVLLVVKHGPNFIAHHVRENVLAADVQEGLEHQPAHENAPAPEDQADGTSAWPHEHLDKAPVADTAATTEQREHTDAQAQPGSP